MAELKDITNHESIADQIGQYHNLISLEADQLQDLKSRIKELDNGDYSTELSAINEAQQCLYQALKSLEIDQRLQKCSLFYCLKVGQILYRN